MEPPTTSDLNFPPGRKLKSVAECGPPDISGFQHPVRARARAGERGRACCVWYNNSFTSVYLCYRSVSSGAHYPSRNLTPPRPSARPSTVLALAPFPVRCVVLGAPGSLGVAPSGAEAAASG